MAMMLVTFGVFLFITLAMAIGAIFANKPLKGSCGGLSNLGLKDNCPICGGTNSKDSLEGVTGKSTDNLFYDAAKL